MAQIAYVCLGASDLDRALAFYDEIMAIVGGKRLFPAGKGQMYGLGEGPMIMVTKPFDDQPASYGNGAMVTIRVDAKEQVAALHAKCLAMGGSCEGPPGPRGQWGEFAYVRDLDGNKLAFFHPAG
ncbi:MAG: VOC family protein [Alphaproteobacteria bacterium]|jgi:catechol 2,3-dioxygenase-like lactoylglutathione lyase family enzyme|nr:VOC family protein [Alphaproteobacteria bacterium]